MRRQFPRRNSNGHLLQSRRVPGEQDVLQADGPDEVVDSNGFLGSGRDVEGRGFVGGGGRYAYGVGFAGWVILVTSDDLLDG